MGIADVQLDTKIEQKVTVPRRYKVVFLNDDATPIDFVILLMTSIFRHSVESATKVTMEIHNKGSGVAGIYSYELAEQKSAEAIKASRDAGFPLQIKVEQE